MDLPLGRTVEDVDGRAESAFVVFSTSLRLLLKVIPYGLGKRMVL